MDRKVLIIDDDVDARLKLGRGINDLVDIRVAQNYEDIEAELKEKPDFVILDISSQILGGIGLMATVAELAPNAVVVVSYLPEDIEWLETANENGAELSIKKPYDDLQIENLRIMLVEQQQSQIDPLLKKELLRFREAARDLESKLFTKLLNGEKLEKDELEDLAEINRRMENLSRHW